jgi:hypothetical protein
LTIAIIIIQTRNTQARIHKDKRGLDKREEEQMGLGTGGRREWGDIFVMIAIEFPHKFAKISSFHSDLDIWRGVLEFLSRAPLT